MSRRVTYPCGSGVRRFWWIHVRMVEAGSALSSLRVPRASSGTRLQEWGGFLFEMGKELLKAADLYPQVHTRLVPVIQVKGR